MIAIRINENNLIHPLAQSKKSRAETVESVVFWSLCGLATGRQTAGGGPRFTAARRDTLKSAQTAA
jgi:hypothetical protein